jgi:hypothetical protein
LGTGGGSLPGKKTSEHHKRSKTGQKMDEFKKNLINELAKGIAYRFDHKKKQDLWTTVDVGVYGIAAMDIVDEYLLPIIDSKIKDKDDKLLELAKVNALLLIDLEGKQKQIDDLKERMNILEDY